MFSARLARESDVDPVDARRGVLRLVWVSLFLEIVCRSGENALRVCADQPQGPDHKNKHEEQHNCIFCDVLTIFTRPNIVASSHRGRPFLRVYTLVFFTPQFALDQKLGIQE